MPRSVRSKTALSFWSAGAAPAKRHSAAAAAQRERIVMAPTALFRAYALDIGPGEQAEKTPEGQPTSGKSQRKAAGCVTWT
jgi:hypothetical protein